jgi:hypothetical protein
MTISMQTHEFVINGVVTNFVAQKLLSPIWGNDYLIFWNEGHAYYLNSKDNSLCGLCGDYAPCSYQMRLKPQDKPWAPEEAAKYLGGGVYQGTAYLGTFSKVTLDGIESTYGNWSYQEMMTRKVTINYCGKPIPAYNKA